MLKTNWMKMMKMPKRKRTLLRVLVWHVHFFYNTSQSSIGAWSWWFASRYTGDDPRKVRTTFNQCNQNIHWKDEAEEEDDEDEDDEKEEDLAASETNVNKARTWDMNDDVKWVKLQGREKTDGRGEFEARSFEIWQHLQYVVSCTRQHLYFTWVFRCFFFPKVQGQRASTSGIEEIPTSCHQRQGKKLPLRHLATMPPIRRKTLAACQDDSLPASDSNLHDMFLISSLFCSSYQPWIQFVSAMSCMGFLLPFFAISLLVSTCLHRGCFAFHNVWLSRPEV